MRLPPFSLERFFAQHEFSARHLLGTSDAETLSVGELLAYEPTARAELEALSLGATESTGNPELRRELARLHPGLTEQDVLVCCGAQEGIFAFMNAVLEPGDHVIAQWPGYQSHFAIARALGAEVSLWRADAARGWAFDPADLEARLRPTTKVVLVSSPHNPTGAHFERRAWEDVIELARRSGAWLLSDEVYRGLEHEETARLPAACDVYERGVSLNSTSKSYGLSGLRIGWLATRARSLLGDIAGLRDYTTISAAAPSELLATIAVRHREALWARSRRQAAHNATLLDGFLARTAEHFAWTRPRAGTTALVRYLGGSASALCERLVRDHGVLLVPSVHFECGDEHVRFGYGRASFGAALEALETALAAR
ncbi:MAG: aminotransferase class I/II-fold pyridoxal phosphate-dependent enzyme [Kofleriaceae bacterium]